MNLSLVVLALVIVVAFLLCVIREMDNVEVELKLWPLKFWFKGKNKKPKKPIPPS